MSTEVGGIHTEVALTETEAYGGADDAASHAFRGPTPRNWPMFERPGTLYVYRSYGLHWCANIVTGSKGDPQAVLLRGGPVTSGMETVRARRQRTDQLTNGPGKLTQALAIDGCFNGLEINTVGAIALAPGSPVRSVESTERIGITKAVALPWRFVAVLGIDPDRN